MRLTTLFAVTAVMLASTAFAEDYVHDPNYAQDVQFYLSRMQYSPLPDPADAGAVDGAYYADLMANNGVKRVNAQLASAEEVLNPHWKRTDERDLAEYVLAKRDSWQYELAFTIAFQDEAVIRGMLSPDGEPYQHESKPAAQLGRETERWVEQVSKGQYETVAPTPIPGPIQAVPDNLRATPEEIQRNRGRDIAEEERRKQSLQKARGDSGPTSGDVIIGATPAPW